MDYTYLIPCVLLGAVTGILATYWSLPKFPTKDAVQALLFFSLPALFSYGLSLLFSVFLGIAVYNFANDHGNQSPGSVWLLLTAPAVALLASLVTVHAAKTAPRWLTFDRSADHPSTASK